MVRVLEGETILSWRIRSCIPTRKVLILNRLIVKSLDLSKPDEKVDASIRPKEM